MSLPTIGALCGRYVADYPQTFGSHRGVLRRLQDEPIAEVVAPGQSIDYITHCRWRRETVSAATVKHDAIYLRGVLAYAKPGWGLQHVTDAPLREAWPILIKQGLIGSSRARKYCPSEADVKLIVAYWLENSATTDLPMADLEEFQFDSTRRISETTRLLWSDLDETTKTILVRDMKHPRHKLGNHHRVALPDRSFEIVMSQPRDNARIFPYLSTTISALHAKAADAIGLGEWHLHDSRRGGTTKLLMERTVPEVMLVTGHITAIHTLTTYNGMRAEDFHRGVTP